MHDTPAGGSDAAPVALVTGAARRIGAAIARALHGDGYRVALHCRGSIDAARALAAELDGAHPGSTLLLRADMADTAALPGMVDEVLQRFGRLDLLVNNASAFFATPFGQTTEAQWDALFDANARGPYFLSQAAAAALRASGGAIVNLLDIYADFPKPGSVAYSASKAALAALTVGLAGELAPTVRVNGVAPGAIAWPEHDTDSEAERRQTLARIPMGRLGTLEEIAAVVLALARGFGYVTGQVIRVDGGRTTRV